MIKVGIDVGNSKISSIVADIKGDGSKKILSFISKPSNHIKKSFIVNVVSIQEEINKIIKEAEKESQTQIKSVNLNLPAVDSLSIYNSSELQISGEMISDLHLKKAINQSDIFDTIENYDIIKNMILGYSLDNKFLIDKPTETFGNKLIVHFYKYAIKKSFTNTLNNLFNKLNIYIENYIPTPLSSSLATLNKDDKYLGAICLDLGASSSSICMYENEKLIFMDAINIGGKNITNDIARGIQTNLESAERLKTLYGSVISSPSDENELIEIPYLGSEISKTKQISISVVNTIIKPRVEETLELIWQKFKDYNLHKKQIKNLILTGGGSSLEGIKEYAQIIFDSNVRIGNPMKINGLLEDFCKPQYSQTIGTILYDKSEYEIDFLENREKFQKNTVFKRFSSWLDKYI